MKIFGMIKLGVILAIFSTAACVMLAFVYTGTSTIIKHRQEADQEAALKELFPNADSFKSIKVSDFKSPDAAVNIESAFAAYKDGQITGAALNVSRGGFSGLIRTMIGVSTEGLITGVKILEHTETPGLGAKAESPKYFVNKEKRITFYGQFKGKSVNDPFEVHKDVDAITASTITSRAVSNSVKAAGIAAKAWLTGNDISSASRGEN